MSLYRNLIKRLPIYRSVRFCSEKRDFVPSTGYFHLDTHATVKYLLNVGFTETQAEAITKLILQSSMTLVDGQNKQLVTKAQQEIMVQQMLSHMASIKKDMVILEKSEFANLRHETEKHSLMIKQLDTKIQDETVKLKSGFKLDLNLNNSNTKDELSEMELKLSKLHSKIDTDIANTINLFERFKADILKYCAATAATCLSVCLAFYRVWK